MKTRRRGIDPRPYDLTAKWMRPRTPTRVLRRQASARVRDFGVWEWNAFKDFEKTLPPPKAARTITIALRPELRGV